jgi:hypothetical protein
MPCLAGHHYILPLGTIAVWALAFFCFVCLWKSGGVEVLPCILSVFWRFLCLGLYLLLNLLYTLGGYLMRYLLPGCCYISAVGGGVPVFIAFACLLLYLFLCLLGGTLFLQPSALSHSTTTRLFWRLLPATTALCWRLGGAHYSVPGCLQEPVDFPCLPVVCCYT